MNPYYYSSNLFYLKLDSEDFLLVATAEEFVVQLFVIEAHSAYCSNF
jgi:hypothetical protein